MKIIEEIKEELKNFKEVIKEDIVIKKVITDHLIRTHLMCFLAGFCSSMFFVFGGGYALVVFFSLVLLIYLFFTTYSKVKKELIKEEEQKEMKK